MDLRLHAKVDSLSQEILDIRKEIKNLTDLITKPQEPPEEWVSVRVFLDRFPSWNRDRIYNEIKDAIQLESLNIECDLVRGTHYQVSGTHSRPSYKVCDRRLNDVLNQAGNKRIPARPFNHHVREAIAMAQVLNS